MRKLGLEFFPHVANHTGRTVQPPRETGRVREETATPTGALLDLLSSDRSGYMHRNA